jgi:hypothetical protein
VAPGSLPFAAELSWVALWAWAPGFTLLLTVSILLFPDGRLPSPRWRPVVVASLGVIALLVVPVAIVAWPYRGEALLFTGAPPAYGAMGVAFGLQSVGIVSTPFLAMASIAGMVVRFRRSGTTERQQLKWFIYAAIPEIAFLVSSAFLTYQPVIGALASMLIGPLLPLATGVAIVRYRLYEVDRIVSRTIAYAAVSGLLVATYAGLILLLQDPLRQITGGDTIAVAVSTLAVAALFQPVRHRVQRVVDRRFDRARYDAERMAVAFAERLRDEVDIETVTTHLREAVASSVKPARIGLWLRQGTDR